MKYTRNFVRRRSRMTAFAAFSRYAGANSNAPVAGLNTRRPQAYVRSEAAQLTLTISGAIDVSATSPCVSINGQRQAPEERGNLNRGPSVPGGRLRRRWGERRSHYKAKGCRTATALRPFSPS